jgi:hypothetical protein
MNELDEFENRNLDKNFANRLIAEELDCSPVRIKSEIETQRTAEIGGLQT